MPTYQHTPYAPAFGEVFRKDDLRIAYSITGSHNNFEIIHAPTGRVLIRCNGFTTATSRELAIKTHMRRLTGKPPVISVSPDVSDRTKDVLRLFMYPKHAAVRVAA